jgi:hypothetical protein
MVMSMSTLMIVLLAVGLSLFIIACVFAIALFKIRHLKKEAEEALRQDIGEENIYKVDDCNFFGIASRGMGQIRGNGLLALTGEGLRFRMLLPRRSLFIPLASIKTLSCPRWFLGKSKAKELLRVDFIDEGEIEDACAWLVRNPQWWGEAITALQEGKEPSAQYTP